MNAPDKRISLPLLSEVSTAQEQGRCEKLHMQVSMRTCALRHGERRKNGHVANNGLRLPIYRECCACPIGARNARMLGLPANDPPKPEAPPVPAVKPATAPRPVALARPRSLCTERRKGCEGSTSHPSGICGGCRRARDAVQTREVSDKALCTHCGERPPALIYVGGDRPTNPERRDWCSSCRSEASKVDSAKRLAARPAEAFTATVELPR